MKSKLLALLRSQEDRISGETLRYRLNTSRVTIWNHIQKLQSLGYQIEASGKGYRLVSSPDTPYPFEFPDREDQIHYYPSIDSTMATAKQMARNGCPHFSVVIAEEQTRGKGRLKRTWFSDPGGLYFTIVLRPEIPVTQVMRYPFAASVVLCRTIRNAAGIDATIKWPNDILFGERKLSGMLCEMEAETEQVSFVNIGIGINVNNDPTPREPRACSLRTILGHPVGRVSLLREFLDAFDMTIQRLHPEAIMEEWKSASATLGKRVRIVTPQQATEGKAIDIDSNGNLVIEQENHHLETVFYGDCFEIPTENAR
ncbi:biotin--[acetyl-CoA-carboxylase] ligase [Desulfatirhabdium butyrativorans]|uniref:biotin--[acetyl-CoA-carboxylase] ligase n=1 Tax=Desulfatirhabdium butyrativorans TaxID=340467 RepID=UPI0004820C92|nr:biotin--[acetyl-CoA-carboxylase] ligase [Desulfatirhabdium butyrativorans]